MSRNSIKSALAISLIAETLFVIVMLIGLAFWHSNRLPPINQHVSRRPDGPISSNIMINLKDGAVMVWVPAGWFIMGSSAKDIEALLKANPQYAKVKSIFEVEIPKRKVYLDGYWIYKNEVTIAQYHKFCKKTKRNMPEVFFHPNWTDDYPITNVTWQDAVDYAKWAGVALPTEAQWEKAARGTDGRTYPWGNTWKPLVKGPKKFQPVGSIRYNKSPYGCMDMGGNVWEWCKDWYAPNYYRNAPQRNPEGPSKPVMFPVSGGTFSGHRVVRSGSSRCASRAGGRPTMTTPYNGFRCAMNPVLKKSSSK